MTSRDPEAELTAYLDGELPADAARALEDELTQRPDLAARLASLRRVVALVATLPEPAPSPALRRAVLARLEQRTWAERARAFFAGPTWVRTGAALAVAAVVAVMVASDRREPVPRPPLDEESWTVAQDLEVTEDFELLGLESADDVEVVSRLAQLEAKP